MGVTNFDAIVLDKVTSLKKADATAAVGANPTKAEFDKVVVLVNEIKTLINSMCNG